MAKGTMRAGEMKNRIRNNIQSPKESPKSASEPAASKSAVAFRDRTLNVERFTALDFGLWTLDFGHQGTSTSFPNCARSSINSCARLASANGSTRSTIARIVPFSTNFIASSSSAFEPMNEPRKVRWR